MADMAAVVQIYLTNMLTAQVAQLPLIKPMVQVVVRQTPMERHFRAAREQRVE
jgi:hypothetical protein